jgi:hypothetical protein
VDFNTLQLQYEAEQHAVRQYTSSLLYRVHEQQQCQQQHGQQQHTMAWFFKQQWAAAASA